MQYAIICDEYASQLESKINKLIAVGWIPQGGISFNSLDGVYIQAMIKKQMK